MKLALMQPYLFPYLGYFQLLNAADKFVIYDDVAWMKGGWINRNYLLINDAASLFTVPLAAASLGGLIRERETEVEARGHWQRKLLTTVELAYRRAPQFGSVYPLVREVIETKTTLVAELATRSIQAVARYLGLPTVIEPGSSHYGNSSLAGVERVLDICRREKATVYLNAPGGRALYSAQDFAAQGITLRFVVPRAVSYEQLGKPFVPNLSIIDVLMFNSPERVRALLLECDLE